MRAAFEAGTNGDRPLVERRCNQALDAEHRLGEPSGGMVEAWVCDARGNLEFTYGSFNVAADHWQEAGERALAAGQRAFAAFEFASAANLRIGGADETEAVEAATRALALARLYCGPATISLARGYLVNALVTVDPDRARALIEESGSDQEEAVQGAAVAARLGDWPLTLRFTRSVIPVLHWQGRPSSPPRHAQPHGTRPRRHPTGGGGPAPGSGTGHRQDLDGRLAGPAQLPRPGQRHRETGPPRRADPTRSSPRSRAAAS